MPEQKSVDERLFPAKLAAALISLAVMIGYFVITLTRGYVDAYTPIIGAITLGLAGAIAVVLARRRKRRLLGKPPR